MKYVLIAVLSIVSSIVLQTPAHAGRVTRSNSDQELIEKVKQTLKKNVTEEQFSHFTDEQKTKAMLAAYLETAQLPANWVDGLPKIDSKEYFDFVHGMTPWPKTYANFLDVGYISSWMRSTRSLNSIFDMYFTVRNADYKQLNSFSRNQYAASELWPVKNPFEYQYQDIYDPIYQKQFIWFWVATHDDEFKDQKILYWNLDYSVHAVTSWSYVYADRRESILVKAALAQGKITQEHLKARFKRAMRLHTSEMENRGVKTAIDGLGGYYKDLWIQSYDEYLREEFLPNYLKSNQLDANGFNQIVLELKYNPYYNLASATPYLQQIVNSHPDWFAAGPRPDWLYPDESKLKSEFLNFGDRAKIWLELNDYAASKKLFTSAQSDDVMKSSFLGMKNPDEFFGRLKSLDAKSGSVTRFMEAYFTAAGGNNGDRVVTNVLKEAMMYGAQSASMNQSSGLAFSTILDWSLLQKLSSDQMASILMTTESMLMFGKKPKTWNSNAVVKVIKRLTELYPKTLTNDLEPFIDGLLQTYTKVLNEKGKVANQNKDDPTLKQVFDDFYAARTQALGSLAASSTTLQKELQKAVGYTGRQGKLIGWIENCIRNYTVQKN